MASHRGRRAEKKWLWLNRLFFYNNRSYSRERCKILGR